MDNEDINLISGPLKITSSGPDFIEDDIKADTVPLKTPASSLRRNRFMRYPRNGSEIGNDEVKDDHFKGHEVSENVEDQNVEASHSFDKSEKESSNIFKNKENSFGDLNRKTTYQSEEDLPREIRSISEGDQDLKFALKDLRDELSDKDMLILEKNETIQKLEKENLHLHDKVDLFHRDFEALCQKAEKSSKEEQALVFIHAFEMLHDSYVFSQGFSKESHPVKVLSDGLLSLKSYFLKKLLTFGVSLEDPIGIKFNPEFHEAISASFSSDKPNGVILQTLKPLWLMDDKVYKKAQVWVSKGREK